MSVRVKTQKENVPIGSGLNLSSDPQQRKFQLQLESALSQVNELSSQLKVANKSRTQAESDREAWEKRYMESADKYRSLRGRKNEEIATLVEQLKTSQLTASLIAVPPIHNVDDIVKQLKKELEAVKSSSAEKVSNLSSMVTDMKVETKILHDQVSTLKLDLQSSEEKHVNAVEELHSVKHELHSQIERLQTDVNQARQIIASQTELIGRVRYENISRHAYDILQRSYHAKCRSAFNLRQALELSQMKAKTLSDACRDLTDQIGIRNLQFAEFEELLDASQKSAQDNVSLIPRRVPPQEYELSPPELFEINLAEMDIRILRCRHSDTVSSKEHFSTLWTNKLSALSKLATEQATLRKDYTITQASLDTNRKRVAELQNQVEGESILRAEIVTSVEQCRQAQEARRQISDQYERTRASGEHLKAEIDRLRSELDQVGAEREENEILQVKLDQALSDLALTESEIKEVVGLNSELLGNNNPNQRVKHVANLRVNLASVQKVNSSVGPHENEANLNKNLAQAIRERDAALRDIHDLKQELSSHAVSQSSYLKPVNHYTRVQRIHQEKENTLKRSTATH